MRADAGMIMTMNTNMHMNMVTSMDTIMNMIIVMKKMERSSHHTASAFLIM